MTHALPMLIDGDTLQGLLDHQDILIIDLSRTETYQQRHIPGAIHLDVGKLMASLAPVMGLRPETRYLEGVLGALGASADTQIIAYDEDSNAKACRLLWTLDTLGHQYASLLDGGLQAWLADQRPTRTEYTAPTPCIYQSAPNEQVIADKAFILEHLPRGDIDILDVRCPAEFEGIDKRAQRAGHIPGAINIDWTQAIDREAHMRLQPMDILQQCYLNAGLDRDRETIVHCQTHQRSSHSYFVLKLLGFKKLRGYPGSWSDWGNDPDTPIETGR